MGDKFISYCTEDWFGPNWFKCGESYTTYYSDINGYICIEVLWADGNIRTAHQRIEDYDKHFVRINPSSILSIYYKK